MMEYLFWFTTGVKERPSEDLTGLEQQTTPHGGSLMMRGKGENCLKPAHGLKRKV